MKYRFINEYRKEFAVSVMCRLLRVARAGFSDITYIRTWQGWLYLAAVVDLYSRWSMKATLNLAQCRLLPEPGPVVRTPHEQEQAICLQRVCTAVPPG